MDQISVFFLIDLALKIGNVYDNRIWIFNQSDDNRDYYFYNHISYCFEIARE